MSLSILYFGIRVCGCVRCVWVQIYKKWAIVYFLWSLLLHLSRAYISDKMNYILIGHKRAEIHSRKVNRIMKKKWILHHCDLYLWPKVTNFNRVWASVVSNHLAKTAFKLVHQFRLNFFFYRPTHRHAHKLKKNIAPPWFVEV